MAFVAAGNSGFFMTVTLVDRNEDTTTIEREIDAPDFATATVIGGEHLADIALVSDAKIKGYAFSARYVNDDPALPAVGELQTRARVTVRLEAGQGFATHDIFAPKETIFRALTGKDNKIVDITNVNVIDYFENFRASSANPIFISDGEHASDTVYLVQGRKVSAKSGLRS